MQENKLTLNVNNSFSQYTIQVLYTDEDMVRHMLLIHFTESHVWSGDLLEVVYTCIILHCELFEVHAIWSPASMFPHPSLSILMDCSPSFPSTGGPTGFSSCSVFVPGGKATEQSSAVFGVLPASSSCASNWSCGLLSSTPCCPIMYEVVALRCLWSPPSTKPAPLDLCEALLVSTAVPVWENLKELFNSWKAMRYHM